MLRSWLNHQGSTRRANMLPMLGPLSSLCWDLLPALTLGPHYDPICGSPLLRINIFLCAPENANYFPNMSIDRQTRRQWLLSALCLCLYPNCQPLSMLEIKLTFLIGQPHKIRARYCALKKWTSLNEVASCVTYSVQIFSEWFVELSYNIMNWTGFHWFPWNDLIE